MSGKNGQKLIRGAISFGGKRYYVSGYTKEEVEEKKAEKRRMLEDSRIDTAFFVFDFHQVDRQEAPVACSVNQEILPISSPG